MLIFCLFDIVAHWVILSFSFAIRYENYLLSQSF